MELETIEVDSCVQGHYVYNCIWTPFLSSTSTAPSSWLLLMILRDRDMGEAKKLTSVTSFKYNNIGHGKNIGRI